MIGVHIKHVLISVSTNNKDPLHFVTHVTLCCNIRSIRASSLVKHNSNACYKYMVVIMVMRGLFQSFA